MIKIISFISLFIGLPCAIQAQDRVLLSGESSYVKNYLIQYLVVQGDAESFRDTTYLFTREIQKIGKTENDGIFSFGLLESHAKEYIFLRANGEIIIMDLTNINISLIQLGVFLEKNKFINHNKIKSILEELFLIIEKNKSSPAFCRSED
jgi:hypothetical protein